MSKGPHSSKSNKLNRNKIQVVFKPAVEWKASDNDFQGLPFSTKMSSVKREKKPSVSSQAGSPSTSSASTSPKSSSVGSKKPVAGTVSSSSASTSAVSKRVKSVVSTNKSNFDSDSDVNHDDIVDDASIDDDDSGFNDGSYNRLDSDQLASKALKLNLFHYQSTPNTRQSSGFSFYKPFWC